MPKTLPIDPKSKEQKDETAPQPDNAPVTSQATFTDARVEPINVQPGNPEKAKKGQETTNQKREAKTREEFFRELTQRNPSSKLNTFIRRSDVAGLPGNNRPAQEVKREALEAGVKTEEG